MAIPLLPSVIEEIRQVEQEDIIAPMNEVSEWCVPIVPVVRPGRKRVRICVDLRKLNKSIVREKYPLPTLDDILHKLSKSRVFSRLDARSGYWQIPLDDASSMLTTFITPVGRFCFKRLPFGITCASEIFQRKIGEILAGIQGVEIYQDDILVHAPTIKHHNEIMLLVLERLKKAGVKLNQEKCELRKAGLEFLGHMIDGNGVTAHPEKVFAIDDLAEHQNLTEVRHVMRMGNYLHRFLPNLAEVAKPINDLLKKETTWYCGPEQTSAFQTVKKMVTECPLLTDYDVTKPTVVSADASSYGLGGVILQQHEEGLKPVAHCSRTLTSAEME